MPSARDSWPRLIDRGHEVIGTFNTPRHDERIRALGAKPVKLDLLDPLAVRKAILESQPDAIINEATALANVTFSRRLDKSFAQTNRLRTEGMDALLAAAHDAGVSRVIAQSFASLRYAREGGWIKSEDDPLDPNPVPSTKESNNAMRHLDVAVTEARGASNVKARRELGWEPRYASWRHGFPAAYASMAVGGSTAATNRSSDALT